MKIIALAGGVGASKLLWGLERAAPDAEMIIVVNTGDDVELHGLSISPDLDIVTYTLAGAVNPATGWGIAGDTFALLEALGRLGEETWFNLGDRDLATHLYRTRRLHEGATLTEITESVRRAFGVKAQLLPMSDQPVRTMIETAGGTLNFQEYLVKNRTEPVVRGIRFAGAEGARPAPGVLEAIRDAAAIVIAPSNPLISIGPILAVEGIRAALRARRERVVAVSPIVGGRSLKGPSDRMLAQLGHEVSALGVARLYRDFAGTFVVDRQDEAQRQAVEALGVRVAVADTVMSSDQEKIRLAQCLLPLLEATAGVPSSEGNP